ncbi:hypothetical protein CA13_71580 [Planctomycetes bacterium CA13]|uniref:Uncharacterized protein n=1 Tax=Novipirellula herctigrandis TaxID=2527986 RepID=A0A5C5YNX0_9BACT|nr:hypothetical protein CA13_71580 [Planctomycetes bacterium CA13]
MRSGPLLGGVEKRVGKTDRPSKWGSTESVIFSALDSKIVDRSLAKKISPASEPSNGSDFAVFAELLRGFLASMGEIHLTMGGGVDDNSGVPKLLFARKSQQKTSEIAMTLRAATKTQTRSHTQKALAILFLFLIAATMSVLCVSSNGQGAANGKFDVIQMNPAFKEEANVRRMERAAGAYASYRGDPAAFGSLRIAQAFFQTYLPGKMTQPDSFEEVSKLTQDSLSYLNRAQRSGSPSAKKLLEWIYVGMKGVAEGNYQTVARINATIALGRLDERVADQANQRPPTPLRYSLPILIKLYEDQKNDEGIRAAGLQGIRRHSMYNFPGISAADRTKLTTLMSDLLKEPTPDDRTEQAHAFLQRYAVDILDYLNTDDRPALAKDLVTISSDPKRTNLIALYSAATVGRMPEELKGQVDAPEKVLENWSVRAWKGFRDELTHMASLGRGKQAMQQPSKPSSHLAPEKPTAMARSGMMGGSGGYDEMMGGGYDDMMSGGSGGEGYEEMMGGGYDDMMMGGGYDDMMMGGGYDQMMGGGYSMPAANPQPPEVVASRKRLNSILEQILLGVTGSPKLDLENEQPNGGLYASVPEAQQQELMIWLEEMQPVVDALNDRAHDTKLEFVAALKEQLEVLRDIAGPAADEVEAQERAYAGIVQASDLLKGDDDAADSAVGFDPAE